VNEDRPASSLDISFMGKAIKGIASTLGGWTGGNRWQLDSKTEKVTSLSPGRGTFGK